MAEKTIQGQTVKGGEAEMHVEAVYKPSEQRYAVSMPKAIAANGLMTSAPEAKADFSEFLHLKNIATQAMSEVHHVMKWLPDSAQALMDEYAKPDHPYSAGFAAVINEANRFKSLATYAEQRMDFLKDSLSKTASTIATARADERERPARDFLQHGHATLADNLTPNVQRANGSDRGNSGGRSSA